MSSQPFRSGYAAIIGLPNSGKSTLLNKFLERHVAITTPRPQTTRHRIKAILNGAGFQVVLLDTPGLLFPTYRLQEYMRREIEHSLSEADVIILVIDAAAPSGLSVYTHKDIATLDPNRTIVALNKVDVVNRPQLLPMAERCASFGYNRVFMVSALKGGGVEDLKRATIDALPEGPPLYPEDVLSDRPEKFFVAEFVREAIFMRYGEEIPYCTSVVIEEFRESPGRKDFIRAVIAVERESQKGILIGEAGRALKQVGRTARQRIEEFLSRPVYLELWVKVVEGWRENDRFIRDQVYPPDSTT